MGTCVLTIHRRYRKVSGWQNIREAMADLDGLKNSNVSLRLEYLANHQQKNQPFLLPGNGVYCTPEIESSTMPLAMQRFSSVNKQEFESILTKVNESQSHQHGLPKCQHWSVFSQCTEIITLDRPSWEQSQLKIVKKEECTYIEPTLATSGCLYIVCESG